MEEVIVVNVQDEPTGVMEKMEAHLSGTLHRAFSVFVFNTRGEMLLQQRAEGKYHSGGLWTNTCCGHPRPGESTEAAASRRLKEEMGFETVLKKAFDFTYTASFANGLAEYEFDHVFTGVYDGEIIPAKEEVQDHRFMPLNEIERTMSEEPARFTAWFHIAFPKLVSWLSKHPL